MVFSKHWIRCQTLPKGPVRLNEFRFIVLLGRHQSAVTDETYQLFLRFTQLPVSLLLWYYGRSVLFCGSLTYPRKCACELFTLEWLLLRPFWLSPFWSSTFLPNSYQSATISLTFDRWLFRAFFIRDLADYIAIWDRGRNQWKTNQISGNDK